MIKSMTGYGRSVFYLPGVEGGPAETFYVEIKSLNHRFLDVNCRLPERFFNLEHRLRDEIKKRFSRGSVTLILSSEGAQAGRLMLNRDLVKGYVEAARELEDEFGLDAELDAAFMLRLKDIFIAGKKESDAEALWPPLKECLYSAFEQMEAWRIKEGGALGEDLKARLAAFEGLVSRVETLLPESVTAYRERLRLEMEKILAGRVEETRLLQEAALYAQRSDFSEETVRLRSHIAMFRGYMSLSEPIGKRLDFLCQEFLREANTIASKANDAPITQTVVEIKGELEKIREQVQNVE